MTAPVPDHAALPAEQLRALLAIPPAWPAHLECGHCGDIAIYADAEGCFTDGAGGSCLTCGFPGQVSCCAETPPHWMLLDVDGARCTEPHCLDCDPGCASCWGRCQAGGVCDAMPCRCHGDAEDGGFNFDEEDDDRLPPPGGNRSERGAS